MIVGYQVALSKAMTRERRGLERLANETIRKILWHFVAFYMTFLPQKVYPLWVLVDNIMELIIH
jgi:hypothetical protein